MQMVNVILLRYIMVSFSSFVSFALLKTMDVHGVKRPIQESVQ